MLRRLRPSPAMSVALLALFVALGGSAYAATGGNFVLGRANKATTTTALTGTPASGSALAVTNGTSGLPAAAFKVTGGGTPLTVNSSARVSNLNADLLDGLDSAAFEPASNSVPMNILQFSVGQAKRFDIGPYASFGVSCYGSGGTTHLDLTIYNHSISDMQVDWSELLGGPSPARRRMSAPPSWPPAAPPCSGRSRPPAARSHGITAP